MSLENKKAALQGIAALREVNMSIERWVAAVRNPAWYRRMGEEYSRLAIENRRLKHALKIIAGTTADPELARFAFKVLMRQRLKHPGLY